MEQDRLEQFLKKMAEDPAIQAQIKSFGGDMDALASYAGELGYEVSAEELRTYANSAVKMLTAKLQEKAASPQAANSPGAKAFFSLIKLAETDAGVAARLEELAEARPEELIAYGKDLSFLFTKQDMLDIGRDILESSDELSDEELELAAGGTTAMVGALLLAGFGAAAALAGGAVIGAGVTGAVVGFVALLGK